MKNNKKTVVYARTSTKKQNLELQLDAAKPFVKGISEEHLLIIEEHGVPISSKREGLQQLLDLIRQDQVETLIVFQRDRLTQNEDEYQDILRLIYSHGVKVILTSKSAIPFNNDQKDGMLFETLILQFINMEKIHMSMRIKNALKMKQA